MAVEGGSVLEQIGVIFNKCPLEIKIRIFSWIWYGMILMLGRVVLVDDWLGWTS